MEKRESKKVISNTKAGITLIALIITIIVLLILASITISLVLDTNLIETVASAKEPNQIESIKERLELVKGSMYVDNKGRASIDSYFVSLNKEKIEPYVVTKSEKFTEYLGVVEVDNKYSFLIRFESNIEIEYEGKIEEIDRKEQIIEIKISGNTEQENFPIMLVAEITADGQKLTDGKWVLNKQSESIGIEQELYEENIPDEENINLKIEEIGEYYIHVLTTDKYGRKKETVKGPIVIAENYHQHTDGTQNTTSTTIYSSTALGGCYVAAGHTHNKTKTCSTEKYTYTQKCGAKVKVVSDADGSVYAECTSCGKEWTADGNEPNYCPEAVTKTGTRYNCGSPINTWKMGCGKTEENLEGYSVIY